MTKLKLPPPNRLAAYLTALAALLGALAPIVADLDLKSTAGVLTAVIAIVTVFREWLKGWREHEAQTGVLERAYEHGPIALNAAKALKGDVRPSDPGPAVTPVLVEVPDVSQLPGGTEVPKKWVLLDDLPRVPDNVIGLRS